MEQVPKGIILSNVKIDEYLNHILQYFKIKNIAEKKTLFSKQIKNLLVEENPQLEIKKDDVYSYVNILILKFYLSKYRLDDLFLNVLRIKELRSYLYYGLLNAIVETNKTFFEMEIAEDEIQFVSNDSIEKTEFGIYFYLLHIAKKYEKNLCIIELPTFEDVIQNALNIDKIVSSDIYPDELGEIKRYYDYMKIGLLNRNLYLFTLMSYVMKNLVESNEIYYDFNDEKLVIHDSLNHKIQKCLNGTKTFTLIMLTLLFENESTTHQNIILIDHDKMTAERFEPHGSTREKYESKMNSKLKLFFAKLGIDFLSSVCVRNEIQAFEKGVPDFLKGKCVTLSFDYLKYRLDSNLDKEKASIMYYEDVQKEGVYHWKEISNKNNQIFKEMQVYLDLLNQTFQTSLYFSGTLLKFK